jgi:hypothetical protein
VLIHCRLPTGPAFQLCHLLKEVKYICRVPYSDAGGGGGQRRPRGLCPLLPYPYTALDDRSSWSLSLLRTVSVDPPGGPESQSSESAEAPGVTSSLLCCLTAPTVHAAAAAAVAAWAATRRRT